jgi:hypothetical protein
MKNERGQALPLAMMTLAVGMIIITPFLGHASASVTGSRTYGASIGARSACDAGVEHAIWRLTRDGLAAQLTEPGDHITYQLAEPVNSLSTSITVTANVSGSNGGTIGDSGLDSLEYDTANGYTPDSVQVSDTVYAIAYRGTGSDGFLKTVSVSADGEIAGSVIDTLEFDTSDAYEPCILHVSGNVFAVAYRGPGNDGFLKTVSIDSSGNIGNAVIDTLEFDTSNGFEPDIINISGSIYAVAYRGTSDDGFLKTVSIAADGAIANAVIDALEFDTLDCYTPDLIKISGNIFAVAYRGQNNDGFLKTVSVSAGGDIGNAAIGTLEFDTSDGYTPCIIQTSENIFAIAYRGPGNDGFLKTVSIDSTGDIGNAAIDTLEFDTSDGYEPDILNVSNEIYVIAYRGTNNDGFVKTLSIAANGSIDNSVVDTLEFDTSDGYEPCIIPVDADIFLITYRGQGDDGFVFTIEIGMGTAPTFEILSSAGGNAVRAYVSTSGENATIVTWRLQ